MIAQQLNHPNRELLAQALASRVAQHLSRAITMKGHAVLAVSGGATPALFFERLANEDITWSKVTVTLVDERQVAETSERSNARLVKQVLLTGRAAAARFVPLYQNVTAASQLSLDVVALGMGSDGHTASFFPGGDTLAEAINTATRQSIVALSAPGSGEPRLTFTLPKLLEASAIFLHIEGDGKRQVLEKAVAGVDTAAMPVRAVLHAANPVAIYWCP